MWDAKDIIEAQERMELARSPFDTMMQEAAQWFLPRQNQFQNITMMQEWSGPANDVRIFDPHGQQALSQGVSVFEQQVMPRGQVWQRWQLPDEELMKLQHVRLWVEDKNRLLFKLRNDPRSGFTGQVHESVSSLLVMGMQSMWPDLRRDIAGQLVGLSYSSEFVGQVFVERDYMGLVSRVHFTFALKADDAVQRWGKDAPERAQRLVRDSKGHEKLRFIHAIKPNRDFDPNRIDAMGKPWLGCFFEREGKEMVKTGGYRAMPRIVSTYERAPNEDYGRCPAFTMTPAVKAAQQMVMDLVIASEMNAMPPLAAHSDMLDQTVKYAAHEVTYGAIGYRGERMLQPLLEGSDMSGSFNLLDRMHMLIDRAFFVDMLQIRQDLKSHVTDSQLYQREEEKGILMSPLAQQETEWLDPMLDREIDLMDEAGWLDDMPGEVREALEGGMGLLDVAYDNGLTRAQDAGAASGYFRMLEQFAPIFQRPETGAWDYFMQKYPLPKVLDHMGRINGIPASWEATDDERAQQEKAAKDKAALTELLEAAPVIGKTARDLAAAAPANG